MNIGPVQLDHLEDNDLEDIYSVARALERDCHRCGCYFLSSMLRAFVTELVVELSVREVDRQRLADAQLKLVE